LLTLHWCSLDADCNALLIQHLLPSIIVFIIIWSYWLSFWQIESQPWGWTECSNILVLFALIRWKFVSLAKGSIASSIYLFINWYSQATAYHLSIIYLSLKSLVKLHKAAGETLTHSAVLFLMCLFLLVSIALTVTNILSVSRLDFQLADSIQEHLVQYSHLASLGFPDPRWHYIALYQIQCVSRNSLCCYWDYSSNHSS
jgi:hypothetical protein